MMAAPCLNTTIFSLGVSSPWKPRGWPSFLWSRRCAIPVVLLRGRLSPSPGALVLVSSNSPRACPGGIHVPKVLGLQASQAERMSKYRHSTCDLSRQETPRYLPTWYTAAGQSWPARCSSRLDMRGQSPCASSSPLRQSGLGERKKALALELQDEDVRLSPSRTSLLTSPPKDAGWVASVPNLT